MNGLPFLKSTVRRAFHYLGGTAITRAANRGTLRICMYHRFGPQSRLEDQCQHIKRQYRPITLTEAAEWLEGKHALPPNALVVTVDDGYRDFLTSAFPVFSAYQIPATVYLATDLLDRDGWLWNDQLSFLFRETRLPDVQISLKDRAPLSLRTGTSDERKQAGFQLKELLKKRPDKERRKILKTLPGLLQVDLPSRPPADYEPLTWDDVRTLTTKGVEFGAHTVSHPILSRLANRPETVAEISGSKARIEKETGVPVTHFCYPNGKWADFDSRSEDALRTFRFRTAVTAEPGLNTRSAPPYRLLRFGVTPDYEDIKFAQLLAGVRYA